MVTGGLINTYTCTFFILVKLIGWIKREAIEGMEEIRVEYNKEPNNNNNNNNNALPPPISAGLSNGDNPSTVLSLPPQNGFISLYV